MGGHVIVDMLQAHTCQKFFVGREFCGWLNYHHWSFSSARVTAEVPGILETVVRCFLLRFIPIPSLSGASVEVVMVYYGGDVFTHSPALFTATYSSFSHTASTCSSDT